MGVFQYTDTQTGWLVSAHGGKEDVTIKGIMDKLRCQYRGPDTHTHTLQYTHTQD